MYLFKCERGVFFCFFFCLQLQTSLYSLVLREQEWDETELKEDDVSLVGGDRRIGQTVKPQSGRSLAANSSSCGTDVFQCASAVAFFFFLSKLWCLRWSRSCMSVSLWSSCFAAPLSLYKTLTWVSRVGRRSLCSGKQQHLCSDSRLLVYPSITAKTFPTKTPPPPPPPPFVHFHSPNTRSTSFPASRTKLKWFSRWCNSSSLQRQHVLKPDRGEKKKNSFKVK